MKIPFQNVYLYLQKKFDSMGAIIIKADKKSNKILSDLARKLGGSVIVLEDEQYEDFALGSAMDKAKIGELSDREKSKK
jgi:hypothetical protein